MKTYRTEQLRNIGLFGHGSAGKTSLAEAMLFNAGAVNRLGRVEEGNTVSDFDPEEIRRRISISLTIAPLEWRDCKINVLDTPGYSDFIGEVCEAVRVVDGAVVVLDAVSGVELGAEVVWQLAAEGNVPRLVVVNRMDRENADFNRVLAEAQERLGRECIAVQMPIGAESAFGGVVDLVTQQAYLGADPSPQPIPAELHAAVEAARERLIEVVCETDDDLIAKYLEGEPLTDDELKQALTEGVRHGKVIPVMAASATGNIGVQALLNTIVDIVPSPAAFGPIVATNPQTNEREELPATADAPLAALVFKTTADPYVGKLTYIRVYAGTLKSDSHVWNVAKNQDERVGQLMLARGKTQEPVPEIVAGDIGAVVKLSSTSCGDTLCNRDHSVVLEGITFPAPLFMVAVHPKTKADLDKLGSSLNRIADEDPTLRIRRDPDTSETILEGMGENHVDIAVERMKRKFGVDVVTSPPKIPYKETITIPVKTEHKHKKQTGGHGQYGHVLLEMEPLPRGSGVEFTERVVGGAVPRNFYPAVQKGVEEASHEGILAHFPVVDVRVTLYDGSYHPVDSSEMSFKIASIQAFKKGCEKANPVLLEPVNRVRVVVPDQYVGDITSDLISKRGRILGMIPDAGRTTVEAEVPQAEMVRYSGDLRSLTQGRGFFSMEFDHYEEVPAHVAQTIISEMKKERELANA